MQNEAETHRENCVSMSMCVCVCEREREREEKGREVIDMHQCELDGSGFE